MRNTTRILVIAGAFLLILPTLSMAVPSLINYQGRLTDDAGVQVNGNRPVVFSLYTSASGGGALWAEGQTVTCTNGVFSVELGAVTGIPAFVFTTDNVYLGIKVDTDPEMAPRQRLTSVGYTFRAESAVNADMLDGVHAYDLAPASHTHAGTDVTSAVSDATHAVSADSATTADDATHAASADNAALLNSLSSAEIIAAASDEVRIPIDHVPFTISSPGSYYFTGDLTYTSASGYAVTVSASNVTIDMMGYTLYGQGAAGTSYGIYGFNRSNVEVRNGTVRDFGYMGVYMTGASIHEIRVIGVNAIGNGSIGIYLPATGSFVKDCTASYNESGISVGSGSTVTGNVCNNNTNAGGSGIQTSTGCLVTGNTCYLNSYIGIVAGEGSTVIGNVCYSNSSRGIYASAGTKVTGNTCNYNGSDGIYVAQAGTVTGNTCYENGDCGIVTSSGCNISGNTVQNNDGTGIWANGQGCAVVGNSAAYNNNLGQDETEGGIHVYNGCFVKGNTLRSNVKNGIYVGGYDNAVEENLVTGSERGIKFGVTGNFYSNNRASGNTTNYDATNTTQTDGGGNVSF